MRRMTLVAFVAACLGAPAWADGPSFDSQAGLPIRLNQQVIATGEQFSWPLLQEGTQTISDQGRLSFVGPHFRKEFAQVDDRVEYTFQFNLPANPDVLTYRLHLPMPRGTTVRVTYDGYRNGETDSLTIGSPGAVREFDTVQFATIQTPTGGYAIDLDPQGAWQDSGNFDKQIRTARLRVRDDGLDLVFVRAWNVWGGGQIRAKLVFYPQPVQFESIHPFHHSSYKTPLEALYFLDFTTRPRTKPPLSAATEPFDPQRGYGWVDAAAIKMVERTPRAPVHSGFATSSREAQFRMTCPPGDYLLTLIAGDLAQPLDPMQVLVNSKPAATFQAKAGRFISKTVPLRDIDGSITLTLRGQPWKLNGLILQPLMLAHEDYFRRQPWWRHDVAWPGQATWPE